MGVFCLFLVSYLLVVIVVSPLLALDVGQHEPVTGKRTRDEQGVLAVFRIEGQVVRLVERPHAIREAALSRVHNRIAARLQMPANKKMIRIQSLA